MHTPSKIFLILGISFYYILQKIPAQIRTERFKDKIEKLILKTKKNFIESNDSTNK